MQHFLIKLLIAVNVGVLQRYLLVGEEHEVIDENLCGLLKGILRVNGTIRRHFKDELVVVGLLLDTIGLNGILDVTDRGVNRIDWNYVHIGAELPVLVGGHISTTFVNGKVNLH